MHLELFMKCVAAVYVAYKQLNYLRTSIFKKTHENVTDHFTYNIFYILSDIYYYYYPDL